MRTSGSHAAATKMVSTPLPIGVMKIWQTCSPMRNEKAMTTGVKAPPSLYPGLVNSRYR